MPIFALFISYGDGQYPFSRVPKLKCSRVRPLELCDCKSRVFCR